MSPFASYEPPAESGRADDSTGGELSPGTSFVRFRASDSGRRVKSIAKITRAQELTRLPSVRVRISANIALGLGL